MDAEMTQANAAPEKPEQWVDLHADVLFRYAYARIGDHNTAEDIVQQTFLAALEGFSEFQGRSSVRTWLISILRNKIAGYLRAHQEEPISSLDDSSGGDFFEKGHWKQAPKRWSADPEEEVEKKEFRGRFFDCIKRLSPALADAFILHEMESQESEAICKELNISDTGLWSRLHRARLNLRQCLEKNWFSSDKK